MIVSIQIGGEFESLTTQQKKSIDEEIISRFPQPLSVSYLNALNAEDSHTRLSIIMKDTTATMLQYLALLLLWDYANNPVSRSERVYFALEQMIYRPAHGKWLGFLREVNKHYIDVGYETRLPQLFHFLETHGFGKSHTKVSVHHDDGAKQKVSTLESLVVLRNAWSHSKSLPKENIEMLANSICEIVRHLYHDLTFLKDYPIYLRIGMDEFTPLQGAVVSTLPRSEYHDVYIGIPDQKIPLLRLLLKRDIKKKKTEILLFEELLEDKGIRYSNSFNNIRILKKDPDDGKVVDDILSIVEKLRPKDSLLSLDRIRFDDLRKRCINYTRQRYDEFLETGKYDPRVYLEPEGMAGKLDEFLTSDKTVYLISGKSGQGKSALVCHWVDRLLAFHGDEHNDYGEHQATNYSVFFLEIHRLNTYTESADLLNQCFRYELGLRDKSSMVEYLRKIFEKKETPKDAKFIMVADGVNEFVQTGFGIRSRSRISLLNEIISFAEMCDRTPGLQGRVKVLITLRWDIYERDGYSRDQFITDRLRFGQLPLFFPDGSDYLSDDIPGIENRAALYEKIRTHVDGYRPNFGWDEVPPGMQKMCSNPLMMRIFMHAFNGKERLELSVKNQNKFEEYFVKRLFLKQRGDDRRERERKQERGKLVLALLKEMKKGGAPHVRLDPNKVSDSITNLIDKPRVQGENDEGYHAYEDLKENKLLREEHITTISEDSNRMVKTKRISFVHDIVARVLNDNISLVQKQINKRFMFVYLSLLLIIFIYVILPLFERNFDRISYLAIVDVLLFFFTTLIVFYISFKLVKGYTLLDKIIQEYLFGKKDLLNILDEVEFIQKYIKVSSYYLIIFIITAVCSLYYLKFNDDIYIVDWSLSLIFISYIFPFLIITFFVFGQSIIYLSISKYRTGNRLYTRDDWKFYTSLLNIIICLPIMIIMILLLTYWLHAIVANYMFVLDLKIDWEMYEIGIILLKYAVLLFAVIIPIHFILNLLFRLVINKLSTPYKQWPINPERFENQYINYSKMIILPIIIFLPVLPILLSQQSIIIDGEVLSTDNRGGLIVLDNKIKEVYIGTDVSIDPQNIASIEELSKLHSIRKLTISKTNISDLTPLKYLTDLEELNLDHNPNIYDYSPIGSVDNIISLSIGILSIDEPFNINLYDEDYFIPDVSFLSNLRDLKELRLMLNNRDRIYIDDLTFIENLHKLEVLHLGDVPVKNIKPLSRLKKLRGLIIEYALINDISELMNCESLEYIYIYSSPIKDISPLGELPNLKSVYLNNVGKISGLSALINLENLESVVISNSEIDDTTSITNLKNKGVDIRVYE